MHKLTVLFLATLFTLGFASMAQARKAAHKPKPAYGAVITSGQSLAPEAAAMRDA